MYFQSLYILNSENFIVAQQLLKLVSISEKYDPSLNDILPVVRFVPYPHYVRTQEHKN